MKEKRKAMKYYRVIFDIELPEEQVRAHKKMDSVADRAWDLACEVIQNGFKPSVFEERTNIKGKVYSSKKLY